MGHRYGISALRTKELRGSDRAPKIAVVNTKAGQFPDHQLQARIFSIVFKEHLGETPSCHYLYRTSEAVSSTFCCLLFLSPPTEPPRTGHPWFRSVGRGRTAEPLPCCSRKPSRYTRSTPSFAVFVRKHVSSVGYGAFIYGWFAGV